MTKTILMGDAGTEESVLDSILTGMDEYTGYAPAFCEDGKTQREHTVEELHASARQWNSELRRILMNGALERVFRVTITIEELVDPNGV